MYQFLTCTVSGFTHTGKCGTLDEERICWFCWETVHECRASDPQNSDWEHMVLCSENKRSHVEFSRLLQGFHTCVRKSAPATIGWGWHMSHDLIGSYIKLKTHISPSLCSAAPQRNSTTVLSFTLERLWRVQPSCSPSLWWLSDLWIDRGPSACVLHKVDTQRDSWN